MLPQNEFRGQGYGFHQIKNSYTQDTSINDPLKNEQEAYQKERAIGVGGEPSDLAEHVKKMKAVTAQVLFTFGDIVPERSIGVMEPSAANVLNNVKAKIFQPTRGGTSVQFLDEGANNKKINEFSKKTQQVLANTFGTTTEAEYIETPGGFSGTTIIPIANVHMTALAMGVVDAKDEDSFNKQLDNNVAYRALYKFFDQNKQIDKITVGLGDKAAEKTRDALLEEIAKSDDPIKFIKEQIPQGDLIMELMHSEQIEASPKLASFLEGGGAVFNAIDLKITNNGSIVIQLAPNNDLTHLKEGLVELGGISKGNLGNMAAITVGYLPNFDKTTAEERKSLATTLADLNNEMIRDNLTVRIENLNFVAFKVNSLFPTHIQTTPINASLKIGQLNFKYLP